MDKHTEHDKQAAVDTDQYRGATVNEADNGKVNDRLVKQDIKLRNSNPHSKGL